MADDTSDLSAFEQAAVATYFEGDAGFYKIFKASAVVQFPADLLEGDAAVAAADVQALRRAAHTLKSVLLTLGHEELSALAKTVELATQQSSWEEACACWQALRERMISIFSLPL